MRRRHRSSRSLDLKSAARDARQAAHDASPETAEQHFKLAGDLHGDGHAGGGDEGARSRGALAAPSLPRGAMLAKAYLDAGDHARAIEWYERAAEAPSPSPEAHHALLYDLASLLEAQGESARALAVLLELQSEAGEYRDVSQRLEQLKVQMGELMLKRLLFVAYFLEVGLLLVLVPGPASGIATILRSPFRRFRTYCSNNYVRGAVSGLGIVNLLIGFRGAGVRAVGAAAMQTMETIKQS